MDYEERKRERATSALTAQDPREVLTQTVEFFILDPDVVTLEIEAGESRLVIYYEELRKKLGLRAASSSSSAHAHVPGPDSE